MIILSVIIIRGFSVDFGHPGTSPALSVFASLIIWSYFEKNISSATTSLVSNASLLRKIYIPRFIPVLSMVLVGLIDFLFPFSFFLILNLLLDNNFNPLGLLIMFPLLFLMATLLFGAGLFMGTLNLKYRDAQLVMPFIIRVLFFTTPISSVSKVSIGELLKSRLLKSSNRLKPTERFLLFSRTSTFILT